MADLFSILKATIDLLAFRHNFREVRKIVGKKPAILPIIKADGYGHGLVPLAKESLKLGAPMLGIGTVAEGIELRHAKIASPILVIDGIFKDEAREILKHHLTPVIFSHDIALELNRIAGKAGKTVSVHLKFDTGMSRLGFLFGESGKALKKIRKLKNLHVEGVMTHLASSPDSSSPQTEIQLARFNKIIEMARNEGFNPKWIHAANSGAIINFPSSRYNMVRPGIILYGAPPCPARGVAFKQVMTVSSRLISVKNIPHGEGVGYNATYVTPRTKKVGLVVGGYAHGVNRLLSNNGFVLWKKKSLLPMLGNICMDNFMVDLSKVPTAKAGDEVILMGPQNDKVSAKGWADLTNSIPYEIFCSLGKSAKKVWK